MLECVESLVDLVHLTKCFDQNSIGHSRGLNLFLNHVLEGSHCTVDVLEPHTCVNEAVVQYLIWHHLVLLFQACQEMKSLVKILSIEYLAGQLETFAGLYPLDYSAVSEVIRAHIWITLHLL